MLPQELLMKIFSHLGTPRDVYTCSQVCRSFADAASVPELWHEVAVARYGSKVAEGTIHLYQGGWKSMLADDNKRGALPTLDYHSKRCNKPFKSSRFVVAGVQWDRLNGKVLVHLDARGKKDLKHPQTTFLCTFPMDANHDRRQYPAESWSEEVSKPGHYRGCLIFDENIFLQDGSVNKSSLIFSDFTNHIGYLFAFIVIETLLPGRLGSFSFDYYALHGSLFRRRHLR
jgi:hypothetical protein